MPVTYVIKFDVVPTERANFLDLLNGVLDAMRHEVGFHEAVLHVDPEDECCLMLYETWEDHDDVLDVQLHRSYREKWHEALPKVLCKPRDVSLWTPLRADWNPAACRERD